MQPSNLSAALIVKLSSTEISIWSNILLHAVYQWKMSIRTTYIKSEKLPSTNWTLSVSSTRVNENSSKIFEYSFLYRVVSKKRPSEIQIQRLGWGNICQYLYPILQTLWENQFSFATLILITSLHLYASFIGAPENLGSQSKTKMKDLFLDIQTTIKTKLEDILEKLSQRSIRREHAVFHMSQNDCDNEFCASTLFLHVHKNSINCSSRISGTLLQYFTCVRFQQCKLRSQLNQILFAIHSC